MQPFLIGSYLIDREIARGGMGVVYGGRSRTGEAVAVKVTLPGALTNPVQRERLLREREVLSRLVHPGIVQALEIGEEQGSPWIAMRMLEGPTLAEQLAEGPLEIEAVIELGRQITEAMSIAHEQGILHRDLKPSNVVVSAGRYVIVDFGLSKDQNVAESLRLSLSGVAQGTPGFWAPEQAHGAATTEATDVHGVGALLYAALTEESPYEGASFLEVLIATRDREPTRVSSLRPDVPSWLDRIVARCLEKEPKARFGSMLELEDAIRLGPRSERSVARRFLALVLLLAGGALGLALHQSLGREDGPLPTGPPTATSDTRRNSTDLRVGLAAYEAKDYPRALRVLGPLAERGDREAMRLYAYCLRAKEPSEPGAALIWLEKAVDLGDPKASTALGSSYYLGKGVPKDQARAARLFAQGVEGSVPSAFFNLALLYQDGHGVEEDRARSCQLYERGAELGHGPSALNLGLLHHYGMVTGQPDFAAAAHWFRRGADLGEIRGLALEGELYEQGRGVERNPVRAFELYREAARAGDVIGMVSLAKLYRTGVGVERDYARAVEWLTTATDDKGEERSGFTLGGGCFELAELVRQGKGTTKDPARAFQLYRRSAELGHLPGITGLGLAFASGTGVAPNQEEAVKCFSTSAAAGDIGAMARLASHYRSGRGVKRDDALAREWFARGAEAGDPGGKFGLAILLLEGRAQAAPGEQPLRLLREAAEANLPEAMNQLGTLLGQGKLLPRNDERAAEWYRRAAETGFAIAQFNMGVVHATGRGVPLDWRRALMWFRRAEASGSSQAAQYVRTILAEHPHLEADAGPPGD
jgi:TPR repeat protein/predicted Ser/Thr protein kinase